MELGFDIYRGINGSMGLTMVYCTCQCLGDQGIGTVFGVLDFWSFLLVGLENWIFANKEEKVFQSKQKESWNPTPLISFHVQSL